MKDRQNVRILLLVAAFVFAWSSVLKFGVRAEKVPETPAEEWLSWSLDAKMRYVHGYLEGFERGKRVACYWHGRERSFVYGPLSAGGHLCE